MSRRKPVRHSHSKLRRLQFEALEKRALLAAAFLNPLDDVDVNEDGLLTPIDVLNVINYLQRNGTGQLPTERPQGSFAVDVDADGIAAPIDVLQVINRLNRFGVGELKRNLTDGIGFATERTIRIGTGQSQGVRKYELSLESTLVTPTASAIGDLFAVYVVDKDDIGKTLVDRGIPGSPVFTMTALGSEITPGITNYDGKILSIDLTSIVAEQATIKLQLLNHDASTIGRVLAKPISNLVDPAGVVQDRLNPSRSVVAVGAALDVNALSSANTTTVELSEIQLNATGIYEADLNVKNQGESIGRDTVVLLNGLPSGVTVENASGVTSNGIPYLNLRGAIAAGGLGRNEYSTSVRLKIKNPSNSQFSVQPTVMTGAANRPPVLPAIPDFTVMPGEVLAVKLNGQDPDGDFVRYSIRSSTTLPTTQLTIDELRISPTPTQIGTYEFEVIASDGEFQVSQAVKLAVIADPITTTRLSGKILDVDGTPISGLRVEVGSVQAMTTTDGSFLLNFGNNPPVADTLRVRADLLPASNYPFIAEKLALVLEHAIYVGYNNQIARPVFLPKLNAGTTINPTQNQTINRQLATNEATAEVRVAAGSLFTQQGTPFTGQLSITEVPPDRTPISLPQVMQGSLVVTIQPGDMTFATPTPLTLPNRGGYPAGWDMDLWSINPTTGAFEIVGKGKVSADGTKIETVQGGIRFSSWHSFSPPPVIDPKDESKPDECEPCETKIPAASQVVAYSGTYIEDHQIPTYSSLGVDRGLKLVYTSARAKTEKIVRFNTDLPAWFDRTGKFGINGDYIGVNLSLASRGIRYAIPGSDPTNTLNSDEYRVKVPAGDVGTANRVSVGVQLDMRGTPDGVYYYSALVAAFSGAGSGRNQITWAGTGSISGGNRDNLIFGKFVKVSSEGPRYGIGWGVAGDQRLIVNKDLETNEETVVVVDGGGNEVFFHKSPQTGYVGPVGDYSSLSKNVDGTFQRRMKDGTVYAFDIKNILKTMTDRNGNTTQYEHDADGRLFKVVDPVGLATTLIYNGDRLSEIELPDGRKTMLAIDGRGDLREIIDPDGSKREFDYDRFHRLVKEITPLGFTETTSYDKFSRVREVTRADGSKMMFSPAELKGVLDTSISAELVSPLPNTSEANTTFVMPSGNVVTSRVNRDGLILSTKDNLGTRSSHVYNDKLQMTETTDSKGTKQTLSYDSQGNPISITDVVTSQEGIFSNEKDIPLDGLAFPGRVTFGLDQFYQTRVIDNTGDGIADIVSYGYKIEVNGVVPYVATLPGDGQGGFLAPILVQLDKQIYFGSSVIEDFNRDGKIDLAATALIGGRHQIIFYSGTGNGQFQKMTTIDIASTSNTGFSLKEGDIDGDSMPDIVAFIGNSKTIKILINQSEFHFAAPINVTPSHAIGQGVLQIADLNGDRLSDIIVSSDDPGFIEVLIADGHGSFTQSQLIPGADTRPRFTIADFTSDGIPDLAIGYAQSSSGGGSTLIYLYRGDGVGKFQLFQTVDIKTNPAVLAPIDLGNNGSIDLIAKPIRGNISDGLITIRNKQGLLSVSENLTSTRVSIIGIETGDVNADGLSDYIGVSDHGGFQILLQQPGEVFGSPMQSFSIPFVGSGLITGDFNGDGFRDIVTGSNQGQQIASSLGNGLGQFGPVTPNSSIYGASLVLDVNSDGRDDIVSFGHRRFEIGFADADGQFSEIKTIGTSLSPLVRDAQAFGDLNADGKNDFAIAGRTYTESGQSPGTGLEILLSDANGDYSRTSFSNFAVPQQVRTGDVDGDGVVDVISIGYRPGGSDGLALGNFFLNDGNGNFSNPVEVAFGEAHGAASQVTSADYNNDGILDFAFANSFHNSTIVAYIGIGALKFNEAKILSKDSGLLSSSLLSVDINHDGKLDIVSTDGGRSFSGYEPRSSFTVFLGDGVGGFAERVSFDVGEEISNINIDDFDENGRFDIVGTSSNTRELFLFGLDARKPAATLTRSFSYGSFSQLSLMTDELGRETRFQVDSANGNVLGIQRPLGANESMTYTNAGLIDIHTDELGHVTDYDYDALGRVVAITSAKGTPDEARMLFAYDAVGNIKTLTDPNGNETKFEYDALRRVLNETDALGSITVYTRDPKGNVLTMTEAIGRVTRFTYDALSRLLTSTDPIGNVTRFGYDVAGNQTSITDANGNTTRKVFDVANRLIRTIDPDGGITKFTYDRNDNLLSVTDPNGNLTRYFYDERNRVVRELDPLGKSSYFLYDGADNLIAKKDRNDRQTLFTYDALDRLTKERWQGDKAGQFVNTITNSYDVGSNLLTTEDKYSKLTFQYDALERVKSVSNSGTPNTASVLLNYAHDDNSNRLSITDIVNGVNGATFANQFDALNRLKNITQTGTGVATKRVDFAFNAIDQYTGLARSNNADGSSPVVTTAFGYDTANRLNLIDHTGEAGTSFASFGFGYDSASRITRITEKNQTIDYGYDKRDQLVSANYGDAARTDEAFKFDANGNRLESNAHGTAYRTGPGNRLTTDGIYDYAYDAEGNRTKRTEIATGNIQEYQWDHRNRLTMLSDKNASGVLQQVVRYSYDSFGRRISKQVDTTPLDTVDAAIEQYVYDGEDVILDFVDLDGSGPAASQQTTRYLRGPGIDNLLAIESATGTNWVLQDHLGSTRALVSSAGVLVQSIDYDSFGKAIVAGSPSTRYLYTGRELDAESGLFYYRARYYDSSTGRFTNEDPIGFAGGDLNLSRYVKNDTLRYIDPFGLDSETRAIAKAAKNSLAWGASAADLGSVVGDGMLSQDLRDIIPKDDIEPLGKALCEAESLDSRKSRANARKEAFDKYVRNNPNIPDGQRKLASDKADRIEFNRKMTDIPLLKSLSIFQ